MDAGRGAPRVPRRARRCRRSGSRPTWTPRPACTAACWPAGGCWSCWTTPATPSRSGRCCPVARLPGRGHQPQPAGRPGRRRRRPPARPWTCCPPPRPATCWPAGSARTGWRPSRTRSTRSSARCARLPLALAIVAARAATHPRLPAGRPRRASCATPGGGLDALRRRRPGHRRPGGLLLVLPRLSAAAARLFRLLGLHPGPDIAAAGGGQPRRPAASAQVRRAAGRAGPGAPGHRAHARPVRLPRPAARLRRRTGRTATTPTSDRQRGDRAGARPLPAHRHAAARLLNPHREPITAARRPQPGVALPGRRRPRAGAGLVHRRAPGAARRDRPRPPAPASTPTPGSWPGRWRTSSTAAGHWHDWAATQRAALDAAQRLGRPGRHRPIAHRGLARAYIRLGRFDDAARHLRRRPRPARGARRPRRPGPHPPQTSASLRRAAGPPPARRSATPSRPCDLFRAAGHRPGRPTPSTRSAGTTRSSATTGRPSPTASRPWPCSRRLGDRHGAGRTPGTASATPTTISASTREAATCYQHALEPVPRARRPLRRGRHLAHLGDTHHAAGDAARRPRRLAAGAGHPRGARPPGRAGRPGHARGAGRGLTGAAPAAGSAAEAVGRP